MISISTLTGGKKTMNMAKLGTVSAAGNYFHSFGNPRKQRAGGVTRYTLCEIRQKYIDRLIYCFLRQFSISSRPAFSRLPPPMSRPLFAEYIPVSESEVEAWLDTVPNLSATTSRRNAYRQAYNVEEKIRAAKKAGTWPRIDDFKRSLI